jgi:N-glycosylase/DNA lyase
MPVSSSQTVLRVADYDLGSTLECGQAFRWCRAGEGWEGVVNNRWVWVSAIAGGLLVRTAAPVSDWSWLENYLQTRVDLEQVLRSFPDDEPLRAAATACRGLRLLRQDAWECLASFILSSTKRISQIRQVVETLCARYGEPLAAPQGHEPVCAFPSAQRLASCAEAELRGCRMGFRAPYLLAAARTVVEGRLIPDSLASLPLEQARQALVRLPGVGRKIADCVLLFGCGFDQAFPVDVWVMKALRQLYFPRRRPSPRRLRAFADQHFGPHAGYAQQYLFHFMRLSSGRKMTP